MKLNVYDIIVYDNNGAGVWSSDNCRKQIVLSVDPYGCEYHTRFLDNGDDGSIFGFDGSYISHIKVVGNDVNYVHSNGIPLIWEDEL